MLTLVISLHKQHRQFKPKIVYWYTLTSIHTASPVYNRHCCRRLTPMQESPRRLATTSTLCASLSKTVIELTVFSFWTLLTGVNVKCSTHSATYGRHRPRKATCISLTHRRNVTVLKIFLLALIHDSRSQISSIRNAITLVLDCMLFLSRQRLTSQDPRSAFVGTGEN